MARATAEEWAKRVERWRDSGLTAKEFAAEAGLNAGTLSGWAWKLRKKGASTATSTAGDGSRGSRGGGRADEAPSFIELPATALVKSAAVLELVVGNLRVRVPAGFDKETLSHVLHAVGACP